MALSQEKTNTGAFLPTTSIFDAVNINNVDIKSQEFKDILVRLYQSVNNIALMVNIKDSGYYDLSEFINGQLFFPDQTLSSSAGQTPEYRQVFRKVIDFGALPNSTSKSVAHELTIDANTSFTRIYGAASDPTGLNYIPLPFAGTGQIAIDVDSTNVKVTTSSARSSYTIAYIVLEYLKQ